MVTKGFGGSIGSHGAFECHGTQIEHLGSDLDVLNLELAGLSGKDVILRNLMIDFLKDDFVIVDGDFEFSIALEFDGTKQ